MTDVPVRFLDLTLPTLAANLALDEALLLQAEEGGPAVLRIWGWTRLAVVLGAGGKLAEDVDETACLMDRVPVLRRSSGGGTVLLGPGCLLYSLVLPYERHPALRDVNASYRHILAEMAAALADLAPGIAQALLATGIGLFAAIPAVVFYNYFQTQITGYGSRSEGFVAELVNAISRQLDRGA